ncbi:hypothetical protein D3C73_1324690 [compost metagenome]
MAMAPYDAMPFQDMTLAVCSVPTWLIPQLRVATPIRPCASPSNTRPPSSSARLSKGAFKVQAEASVNTPQAAMPSKP